MKCESCGRCFFGATCLDQHRRLNDQGRETETNSVCYTYEKCTGCRKVLKKGSKECKKHICGFCTSPCCKEKVDLSTHLCYLQPAEDEAKKRKRRQRKRKRGEAFLAANDLEAEGKEEDGEPLPPLFVYADVEARQEGGVHVANVVCAERNNDDEQFEFEGDDCVKRFLNWLRELTVTEGGEEEEERQVICVFPNFQGYGSYFTHRLFSTRKTGIFPTDN